MRLIGLDPGLRRIGVALSVGSVALPLAVVERSNGWIERIRGIVAEYSVDLIAVGVPLALGGSTTESTLMARQFIDELTAGIALPVVEVDERFSSLAAERALSASGVSTRKQRGKVDDLAAADILQRYLDRSMGE